jgi:hypothetical protein
MSRILAGRFQLQDQIDAARNALIAAGFPEDRISAFYVNQPGQHDTYGIGGDREKSPGAKETPEGVAKGVTAGGAVGAAVGAAASVVTGPIGPVVGALVGAHVGSLYSFNSLKEKGEGEEGGENLHRPREAGMLIAVALDEEAQGQRALDVFRELGALHVEQAEGTISAGDWSDFDPLSTPRMLS